LETKATESQGKDDDNATRHATSLSVERREQSEEQPQQNSSSSLSSYMPPFWSAAPSENKEKYYLEVIKEGTIISTLPLGDRPYYLIGRAPICDIVAEHPSISRQHAVLQFRQNGECYLYDVGSTHGTLLNKRPIKPKAYVRLRNGYHMRFGQSTRTYIFHCPEAADDVAELRRVPTGAMTKSTTETLEIKNTEDEDEYTSSKKAKEEFQKRVVEFKKTLMDDAEDDIEHTTRRGKKQKKQKKNFNNEKNMTTTTEQKDNRDDEEENVDDETEEDINQITKEDFEFFKEYFGDDDDEEYDEFYDRTGQSRQTKKRKKSKETAHTPPVDTYESLCAKQKIAEEQKNILLAEIQQIESKIKSQQSESADSLDEYMALLAVSVDKEKLQRKYALLKDIEKELQRLAPLIELTRPAIEKIKTTTQQKQPQRQLTDGCRDQSVLNYEQELKKRKRDTDVTPPPLIAARDVPTLSTSKSQSQFAPPSKRQKFVSGLEQDQSQQQQQQSISSIIAKHTHTED
jgi:pSer/pThr/pTyr-binding forkhead associated (FHA) protein